MEKGNMITKLKSLFFTTVLGGVTVILPLVILSIVFTWFFKFVTGLIQPFTNILVSRTHYKEIVADAIVLVVIVSFCFFLGLFVRTKVGHYFVTLFENRLLRAAPGYEMIKEMVLQLLGNKKNTNFSSVVLVRVFSAETLSLGFVVDELSDGWLTVFVPTSPNPTTGFAFHVKSDQVIPLDIKVEEGMKNIISCGFGSSKLFNVGASIKKNKGFFA